MTQFFEPEAPEIDPSVSCSTCEACCCKLEVLLMGDDDVPLRFVAEDEWGGAVMRRLDDDWCAALDRNTMLCTIYERRPDVCRVYQMGAADCLVERSRLIRHTTVCSTQRPGDAA